MRFILIRHGQTDWNLEKRVQGRTDMPLNAQGIRQAELVAKAVLRYPVERIYASSLERAWETAEIVRQAFLRGIPGTEPRKIPEVIRLPELIEVAFGAWEGKTLDEISRRLRVTPEYLGTLFHREVGTSFSTYIRNVRIDKAKELLCGTQLKLYQIAEETGYSDPKYFSKVFREVTGFTPAEYRKNYQV